MDNMDDLDALDNEESSTSEEGEELIPDNRPDKIPVPFENNKELGI